MAAQNHNDSLSFGDALFLYLERDGMPLHIASVSVFDGPIAFNEYMRFVESRIDVVPRYRQRVQIPPLNLGLPTWTPDPNFDLRNHVRQVRLARSTTAAFKDMAARILGKTMDHSRPLWDLTLVHGLPRNQTGLVIRVHHCLADGLAGIGLMNALMDTNPTAQSATSRPHHAAPIPAAEPSLLDTLVQSSLAAVQQLLSAHSEVLTFAETLLKPHHGNSERNAAQAKQGFPANFEQLLPGVASPAERMPFNKVCRGPQKFHWAEIPLGQIKAVKNASEATVNEVALATIASVIRQYVQRHGVAVDGRSVRIVVPVSIRAKEDAGELGNRITFIPVTLPLDIARPKKLMAAVREQMTILKETRLAEMVGFVGTLLGTVPTPLQALLGPLVSQLPLSVCNLIFTNVRGSEVPLFLLGRKMIACYPYVPIGGEMGMNCAMLTYNGTAFFGFTGDVNAVPDLGKFEKLLAASFGDLKRSLLRSRSASRPRLPRTDATPKHATATSTAQPANPAKSPTETAETGSDEPTPPRVHAAVA